MQCAQLRQWHKGSWGSLHSTHHWGDFTGTNLKTTNYPKCTMHRQNTAISRQKAVQQSCPHCPDTWRPINCKYADVDEPDPKAFLRAYGHHIWCVPMVASQLTGPQLQQGLARMHPSALSLDGWSLADLRSLLDTLLGWLADLLQEVDCRGSGRPI